MIPRQVIEDVPVPECTLTCAVQVPPSDATCIRTFSTCLASTCTISTDYSSASTYTNAYCAGQGIVHAVNGVFVTVVPPSQWLTWASGTFVQVASPTPTVIDPQPRQGDFILPTHRSTRGKSFLIDGESFKKNSYVPDAIELLDKSQLVSGSGPFDVKLEDRPLPAVPIPTKSSNPAPSASLPRIMTAVAHPPSRNYIALPGRESSPSASTSSSPVDVRSPPGLDGSVVSQTFAAGRERAMSVLRQSTGSSPTSPSSSSGSTTPSSSSSSSSSSPVLNTSVYATAARTPIPAYSYQPVAPSPLRAQVAAKRVYSTIIEEPRTPYSATMSTTPVPVPAPAPAPSLPPLSFSQMHSTVGTARPAIVSHARNPRSTENLRQFTFPMRQSLNDTELQITVSEALREDGLLAERERSETPNGSMHRGAGGSISSVKERFQALVGGMRRDTRE
ncbi:hypothetical protein FRC07_001820 [Ceratobasidium sp. 392]|nr:hypothetical protein FRC07_001820 [Ceratobasidium sp. 392]